MLTDDLKEITYPEHQSSEKKLLLALKRIETHEHYVRILRRLYGFYSPVENLIRKYLVTDIFPDMAKRCRTHQLLTDIRNYDVDLIGFDPVSVDPVNVAPLGSNPLGFDPVVSVDPAVSGDIIEICCDLPMIDSTDRALGALYVLEGSTLGGRIIADMIARRLGLLTSLEFFDSYGDETQNMWRSFKDFLNKPRTAEQQTKIIDAAKDTFITFKNWIGKHELQPQL